MGFAFGIKVLAFLKNSGGRKQVKAGCPGATGGMLFPVTIECCWLQEGIALPGPA